MVEKKSIWNAIFIDYEILNDNKNYRRLNFIDVRNRNGILIEKNFFIDETEELQIRNINKSEIVCFLTADEKLENVIKFHPSREEIHSRIKKEENWVLGKLKEKRKNERSK